VTQKGLRNNRKLIRKQRRSVHPRADYIDPADFPVCWLGRRMTVDVEAKAKVLAVILLMDQMKNHLDAPVP
jgi:hypothetical protein